MKSFYVSPNGNDAWSGAYQVPNSEKTDGPFASLLQARDAIRTLKASTGLPPGGVKVIVCSGEYMLREPITFGAENSGTAQAPIVYLAAEAETVSLSGGMCITDWQPVDDADTLKRLPADARGKVLRADLRAHGVADFGETPYGHKSQTSDPGLELFFRHEPMTLARYPNEGYLHVAELSVDDGHHIRGTRGSHVGRFRTTDVAPERLRRWEDEPDLILHGYWFWDWSDQRIPVKAIDPDAGEITLDDNHPHHYGYRAGQWFYAFNLLCELDEPGEWYLDRENGILYFYPPDRPEPGDIRVSVLRDPIKFDNARHITLQDLNIEMVRGTAIQIKDGASVRIVGCTLRNIGADAVRVDGGNKHCVSDCDIYRTGDGGIYLEGGDRPTLTPGGHEAVNNHVHHISRWNPLYKVGIQLKGVGNRAAHNRLHDLPHIGIGFTGNDQIVEYNEIYQAVTQANDAGAIYTAGAHPEDWTMRGHRVRFNYLHHMLGFQGEGCNGIYLDDMFSGTEIKGNILYKVSQAMLLGGGRDILTENNIFINCPTAVSLDARAIGWASFSVPQLIELLDSVPYREERWASRYPELVNILDDEPALPKGNVISHNIICGGRGNFIEEAALPGLTMTRNLRDEDPLFVDREHLDFRLQTDSPAWKLGFEPIPVECIGLQTRPLRPTLPPRELFEADLLVEQAPVMRSGRCFKPCMVKVLVRNIGETTETRTLRIRAQDGHLIDADHFQCALAPFESYEHRFEVQSSGNNLELAVTCNGVDSVLCRRKVQVMEQGVILCETLLVSTPQPNSGRLDSLERVPPDEALQWQRMQVDPDTSFFDVHSTINEVGEDAVIYFGCRVRCIEPMRVAVLLGYDGPVKLFVDGSPVFHDPAGTNPARPDMAAPEILLTAGEHELVVALGTNFGRAWGIFLRLRRNDLPAEYDGKSASVLPEFLPVVSE